MNNMNNAPSAHFEKRTLVRRDENGHIVKKREIVAPDETTKEIHEEMLLFLYRQGLAHDHKTEMSFTGGALPRAKLIDNIKPHRNGQSFYMIDLENAFGSVDIPTLHQKLLEAINPVFHEHVSNFIDNFATTPLVEGLPQGAPCSPYLFNFYCQDLDDAMVTFCSERGLAYSRWLDDITVSSPEPSNTLGKHTRKRIRDILMSTTGMEINHAKSRLHYRVEKPVTITGISLYPDGRVQVNPELLNKIRLTISETVYEALHGTVTPNHLDVINGYYSSLLSMGVEPRSRVVAETIETCQIVARVVRNALYDQEHPPEPSDPEVQRIVKSILRAKHQEDYRRKLEKKAAEQRQDFQGIGAEAVRRLRDGEKYHPSVDTSPWDQSPVQED